MIEYTTVSMIESFYDESLMIVGYLGSIGVLLGVIWGTTIGFTILDEFDDGFDDEFDDEFVIIGFPYLSAILIILTETNIGPDFELSLTCPPQNLI